MIRTIGFLVTLAVGAALIAIVQAAQAPAQPVPHETNVLSDFVVRTDSLGRTNLPEFSGRGDGVRGASCGGAGPFTGPNIPVGVVTDLQNDLTHMRVFRANGTLLTNRDIRVNCTLTVPTEPSDGLARMLRQHASS